MRAELISITISFGRDLGGFSSRVLRIKLRGGKHLFLDERSFENDVEVRREIRAELSSGEAPGWAYRKGNHLVSLSVEREVQLSQQMVGDTGSL